MCRSRWHATVSSAWSMTQNWSFVSEIFEKYRTLVVAVCIRVTARTRDALVGKNHQAKKPESLVLPTRRLRVVVTCVYRWGLLNCWVTDYGQIVIQVKTQSRDYDRSRSKVQAGSFIRPWRIALCWANHMVHDFVNWGMPFR